MDLQIGPEGSLYYLARGSGSNTGIVARIDYTGSRSASNGQRQPDAIRIG